jgi:hypothetical protein
MYVLRDIDALLKIGAFLKTIVVRVKLSHQCPRILGWDHKCVKKVSRDKKRSRYVYFYVKLASLCYCIVLNMPILKIQ